MGTGLGKGLGVGERVGEKGLDVVRWMVGKRVLGVFFGGPGGCEMEGLGHFSGFGHPCLAILAWPPGCQSGSACLPV